MGKGRTAPVVLFVGSRMCCRCAGVLYGLLFNSVLPLGLTGSGGCGGTVGHTVGSGFLRRWWLYIVMRLSGGCCGCWGGGV